MRTRIISRIIVSTLLTLGAQASAHAAGLKLVQDPSRFGFAPIDMVSPANFRTLLLDDAKRAAAIKEFCGEVAARYAAYGWKDDPCGDVPWRAELRSKGGRPLIYAEFGQGEETTLLLGGVHPDELTPIPIAFRMARHLHASAGAFNGKAVRVVVAPLVNPDGFLRKTAKRTNDNGVDVNRNFLTLDWYAKAKKLWTDQRESSLKHYPGYFPNSEIETIFQIRMIDRHTPDKILSIHAPLGFLDYDGPGDRLVKMLTPSEKRAKQLVHTISEKSSNYKVVDYTFYPGSLGNYAGNERDIPTVTLELETTRPELVEAYWKQFLPGMMQSIHYPFRKEAEKRKTDASPLSVEYAKN